MKDFSLSGAPFVWIWSRRPRAQGGGTILAEIITKAIPWSLLLCNYYKSNSTRAFSLKGRCHWSVPVCKRTCEGIWFVKSLFCNFAKLSAPKQSICQVVSCNKFGRHGKATRGLSSRTFRRGLEPPPPSVLLLDLMGFPAKEKRNLVTDRPHQNVLLQSPPLWLAIH